MTNWRRYIRCLLCVMAVYALPVNGMSKEDSIFNERCKHIDWPILYIVTRDSVLPTFTRVEAPEGCDGIGITNNEKVPGRMVIVLKNDTVYDSGEYKKDTAGMTIRVRGNSSAYYTYTDKKPYKIKLEKKCDLLFRGNENLYADKDWVLLRHALCETLVGNMVNRAIGMEWTPAEQPVFVFLNDSYWGVYMLTENVKRSKCRVDIDKDGYLFEYDAYWWNEDFHIESRYYYNYTLKYPASDEISAAQLDYLTAHLQTVESVFHEPEGLDSVIDIHSYARWLWVHDIIGTRDGGGSNMYLVKKDESPESKQAMICAWDFDGSYAKKGQWSAVHDLWWFWWFFNIPQKLFVNEYIRLYDTQVVNLFDKLVYSIDSLMETPLVAALDSAYVMENQRWSEKNKSASHLLQTLRNYLLNRKTEVASLMDDLRANYVYEAVPTVIDAETYVLRAFDILGRPIPETTASGFVIIRKSDGTSTKQIRIRN